MFRITQADIEEMRARGYDRSTIAEAERMLQMTAEADAIVCAIEEAFRDVRLEDGIGLRESGGLDDYAGPEALKKLRESDEKDDWRRISLELLNQYSAAASFLDAKGMRFHLPALLTAELRDEYDHDIIGRVVENSVAAADYVDLLNDQQRDAVAMCLRFFLQFPWYSDAAEDIEAAIHRIQKRED